MTVTETLIQVIDDLRTAQREAQEASLERTRDWFREFDGVGIA